VFERSKSVRALDRAAMGTEMRISFQNLVGKLEDERRIVPRLIMSGAIIHSSNTELRRKIVDSIHVVQNRVQCQEFVNTTIKLHIP
jgi:hypothetical protein